MTDIIAYVTVTEYDFWQGQAHELKHNLAEFGLELYIDTVNRSRIESFDLDSKYSMCDHAFIEFAEQETRRILLLNAEIRMHRPMPQDWIDSDLSVIFYNKPRLGIDINNGQGIWDSMGVSAYRRAMDIVRERGLTQEEVEENTVQWLGPHIKASMSLDRFAEPDADATRGYWRGPSTVFTHPYIDGLSLRAARTKLKDAVTKIPLLRHRDLINHFSPDDENLARIIYDHMLHKKFAKWSTADLPMSGPVTDILSDPPGNLFTVPGNNHLVYSISDWKFCPSLGLCAPVLDWPRSAYKIAELDDGR